MPTIVYEDTHLNVTKMYTDDIICKIHFKFWVDKFMNK